MIKKTMDVTGVELMPGEPTVCLGNGVNGSECCCDECDYYLLCFPEFDFNENSEVNFVLDPKAYEGTARGRERKSKGIK